MKKGRYRREIAGENFRKREKKKRGNKILREIAGEKKTCEENLRK